MHVNNLANIEALINMFANLTEIAGIRYGIGFALAALFIVFLRKWKLALRYLLIGVSSAAVGLSTPVLVNWIVASTRAANNEIEVLGPVAIVCAILFLIEIVAGIGLIGLPVFIAKKRSNESTGWIFGLCVASVLIGFLWSVALFLAHRDGKKSELQQDDSLN